MSDHILVLTFMGLNKEKLNTFQMEVKFFVSQIIFKKFNKEEKGKNIVNKVLTYFPLLS